MAWAAPGTTARRVLSLIRKEMLQVMRDPSSIALALVMPVILILLFGYGLSLDVRDVPVAVVMENPTPDATDLAGGFVLSPYFKASFTTSMRTAEEWMKDRKVDAIVRFRANLARELQLGNAPVQVIAYGVDANRARIIQGYAQGVVKLWAAKKSSNQGWIRGGAGSNSKPHLVQRCGG